MKCYFTRFRSSDRKSVTRWMRVTEDSTEIAGIINRRRPSGEAENMISYGVASNRTRGFPDWNSPAVSTGTDISMLFVPR